MNILKAMPALFIATTLCCGAQAQTEGEHWSYGGHAEPRDEAARRSRSPRISGSSTWARTRDLRITVTVRDTVPRGPPLADEAQGDLAAAAFDGARTEPIPSR